MDNTFDKMYYHEGNHIAGIDESGVSDIAGPLVASCVILPKIEPHKDDIKIFAVDDSKKIPEKYRKQHAEVIWETAIGIGIGEVSPSEIDYLGKQIATSVAMIRAVMACKTTSRNKLIKPNFILIDGDRGISLNIKQALIKDGDAKSLCIAAASIVAKVYRDEIMIRLHDKYPHYDWISNKGFPCENQFVGIDKEGVQIGIHRITSWPFIPTSMYPEDPSKDWKRRRKKWRQITEEKLTKELVQDLWVNKPPVRRK